MNTGHFLLCFYWILFCGLHSLLAGRWWKRLMQNSMGGHFRFYRLYYTLFAFLSLGGVIYYHTIIASPYVFTPVFLSKLIGVIVALSGLFIMAICIRKYFMHLSGLKSLYLNDEQAANQLQITGIHRFVRHPLYSGTFAAIWGAWIFVPQLSLLLANLIITLYTVLAISWEEQKLVAEFGDRYKKYQRSVPKLFPLLRKPVSESF